MKPYLTFTSFLVTILLAGCAAPQNYSFPCDSGRTSFSLSSRWHSSKDSPKHYDSKSITYEFTPDGPRYVPSLSVTAISRPKTNQDEYAEQHQLAEESLKELRSTNWKNGGFAAADTYTRRDKVDIIKWAEVSNGIHIVAYVPRQDCIIRIDYSGHLQKLAMYEKDIDELIDSIPLR